jgi:hypothetical protein
MIPFEDLVAALDSWRARNGMPVGTTDVVSSPRPVVATAPVYVAPRPVSPVAMPSTESDVMSIDDAEVEDEMYENEGDDFAMSFGGAPAPAAAAPAPAPAPAPMYDDEDQSYEMTPAPAVAEGTYDDPAYDEPPPVEAAPAAFEEEAPPAEEEELDDDAAWAKLYPGSAAGAEEVPEEATVVGHRPEDDDQ